MNIKYINFLLLIFFITGVGCMTDTNRIVRSANTPEDFFKGIIANPIPEGVVDIKGYGETSQGHNIFLAFNVSEAALKTILTIHEYKKVSCTNPTVVRGMRPSAEYMSQMPYWVVPTRLKENEIDSRYRCYTANGYSNTWTSQGTSEIFYNEDNSEVFFHEVGI